MKSYRSAIVILFLIGVLSLGYFSYLAGALSAPTDRGAQISFVNVSDGKFGGKTFSNFTNVSGGIRLNATISYGTSHVQGTTGKVGITNLTYVFIHSSGTYYYIINLTNGSTNGTAGAAAIEFLLNATYWNSTLDTTVLPDGNYTITVNATNYSGGTYLTGLDPQTHGYGNATYGNRSFNNLAFAITIDNTPPAVHFLVANISNRTNLTAGTMVRIEFNISANDTTTWTETGRVELRNATGATGAAGTGVNFTLNRTNTFNMFTTTLTIYTNNTNLSDDEYQVYLYLNDTLNNTNVSIATNFSFRKDTTAPIINNFSLLTSGARNQAGNFLFNLSNISNSTPMFLLNFTDNLSRSANCTVFVNWTTSGAGTPEHARAGNLTAANGAVPNSTSTNITSTGTVPDGPHIAYAVCVDASSNFGNSTNQTGAPTIGVGTLHFRVDTTSPNASAETFLFGNYSGYAGHGMGYVGINLSAGLSEGNYTLWAMVNDTTSRAQVVRFNLSNRSGSVVPFNYTATLNGSNYTTGHTGAGNTGVRGPFNVSQLAEGWYNLTVWTNDTVGNINNSLHLSFVIDRTKPAVTVTCSPSAPTAGQTVACSCTGSDEYPGSGLSSGVSFAGGGIEESTTATGSGTFSSSTCTGVDYAGNSRSATGSWTVSAASSGGSGGGGSGGGSASGVTGQFEKKVWTSINAGETAAIPVKNGVLGVTEVSFGVNTLTYGVWVQITKKDALPSTIEKFSGDVYRTLEITRSTTLKDTAMQTPTIKFKVEKAWLEGKNLAPASVALFRYADGKWNELPTTRGEDDGTYVHYTATTPGFSYFVIGEKTGAPAAEAEVAVPAPRAEVGAPAEEGAVVAGEVPAEEAAGKSTLVWLLPLVVALIVIVAIYAYWKSR